MGRKALLLVLVLIGLAFAAYVVAQIDAPIVDEVSVTETVTTGGAGRTAAIPAAIETNESEKAEIEERVLKEFWEEWNKEWKNYDKEKFQVYINQTRIEWFDQPELLKAWPYDLLVVGKILVNESPVKSKDRINQTDLPQNPVEYFENNKRENCVYTSKAFYELLSVKGEEVRLITAGDGNHGRHFWVEIKKDNKWYVAEFCWIIPLEKWAGNSKWTGHRLQLEP